jgi:hypothetical protein
MIDGRRLIRAPHRMEREGRKQKGRTNNIKNKIWQKKRRRATMSAN